MAAAGGKGVARDVFEWRRDGSVRYFVLPAGDGTPTTAAAATLESAAKNGVASVGADGCGGGGGDGGGGGGGGGDGGGGCGGMEGPRREEWVWSAVCRWGGGEVTVATEVPPASIVQKACADGAWGGRAAVVLRTSMLERHFKVPLVKSNLQKAVRRHEAAAAVASALQMLLQDPQQLLRRLPIIAVEDAFLHPWIAHIVWCLLAESKGYFVDATGEGAAVLPIHANVILGFVGDLARKETCPTMDRFPSTPAADESGKVDLRRLCLSKFTDSPRNAAIIASLCIRAYHGGMKFDVTMLRNYCHVWTQRLVHGSGWSHPQWTLFKTVLRDRDDIIAFNAEADPTTRQTVPQWAPRIPLQRPQMIPAAADMHCTGILRKVDDEGVAFGVSSEQLKRFMWDLRSGLNFRRSASTHSGLPVNAPPCWKDVERVLDRVHFAYWRPIEPVPYTGPKVARKTLSGGAEARDKKQRSVAAMMSSAKRVRTLADELKRSLPPDTGEGTKQAASTPRNDALSGASALSGGIAGTATAPRQGVSLPTSKRMSGPLDSMFARKDAVDKIAQSPPNQRARKTLIPVKYETGDLLQCGADLIVHQVNACSSGSARGLASCVFAAFPAADQYKRSEVRVCGHVYRFGSVINLVGQKMPGKPNATNDSKSVRLRHFHAALAQLELVVRNDATVRSIAFPKFIGCGLAGGEWTEYETAICDFARSIHFNLAREVTVRVVQLAR